MGISEYYRTCAISKGEPRALRGPNRRKENDAKLRAAYADVDARDGGYSVISSIYTVPGAIDERQRREHHHVAGRNVRPDWKYSPERIITVTALEHKCIEDGLLQVEGDDARKPMFFHWNRKFVKPGKEPFKLRSKRWSANR